MATMDPVPMLDALVRLGLVQDRAEAHLCPLEGGIASDIWKVELPNRTLCIKRALHQLKVPVEWMVPVERNLYEARYYEVANKASPGIAPCLIEQDRDEYLLVMEYLEPEQHPLWKNRLRDGIVDINFAAEVGSRLAAIHSYTALHTELRKDFPSDHIFYAARMESYLETTGRAHPDLQSRLNTLIQTTMHMKLSLVHGDVSPKNILCGPNGPVILDAECAFYGDPAFDLAFCLNHLLLKCLWNRESTPQFLQAFTALARGYLSHVDWEDSATMEARTTHLLPGLFLARIDGKSPVEYVTRDLDRELVRRTARPLLLNPVASLQQIADTWAGVVTG
jgi:tRNA A-37 threonylcarbamoyl transferase component Bud32